MPSSEVCCEIAAIFFAQNKFQLAIKWYESARKAIATATDFVSSEYLEFIPCIMLCVCYDKLGELEKAFRYHKLAQKCHSNHQSVLHNEAYFSKLGF